MDISVAEETALELDRADPLAPFRERFHLPRSADGGEEVYLCGHSLGLQPRGARAAVEAELESWRVRAVEGHFRGPAPWFHYDERFRAPMSRLVGAHPDEIALMNGLSVNLHLMLASFYRPAGRRVRILLEEPAFPSDAYVVQTHLRVRELDPERVILRAAPPPGARTIPRGHLERRIEESEGGIALVLLSGINFLTGQFFDLESLAAAAHRNGCLIGVDLAHAVGNVPLRLHEWNVDFAVWCNYKYVNAGPGAVGGAFIHRRHAADAAVQRLGGWWGNDPAERMSMRPEFTPRGDAAGWQISNPPILSLAPLGPALELFDGAGLEALHAKSVRLTAYLEALIEHFAGDRVEILTPRAAEERGAQLSLRVPEEATGLQESLRERGIICDARQPDILRLAPAPLYNTFHEAWRTARSIGSLLPT